MNYFDPHKQKKHSKWNRRFTLYYYRLVLLWNRYLLHKKIAVIHPWISMSWGCVEHNNWGDDINMFFLRQITKDCLLPQKVFAYPGGDICFPGLSGYPVIFAIGSILDHIDSPNAIVWGAGLLTENNVPKVPIKQILAVRGPLTRKVLLKNGFDCPEVYGDPALLLPYFYTPKSTKKKYRLGIVPHYVDYNKNELLKLREREGKDVIIIKMSGYKKWVDVIEQINSCDFIVSSSLHGLIVAEAYGVPNLWVEIGEPILGDVSRRFKFYDFFQSIGSDRDSPFLIGKETTIEEILNQKDKYKKTPVFSLDPLIKSCPFKLSIQRK